MASATLPITTWLYPRAFVLFKLWMTEQKNCDPLKRRRGGNQAKVVP